MAMPLHELLERRFGVDEDEFAAALEDFAEGAGPIALVDVRPADYFGEAQRSTLTRLGASLRPLRPGELGPIAGLAAAHAQLVSTSLNVADLAERLGVDPSRVRQRIYGRSLHAFKHRGVWLIPTFQLEGAKLLPGITTVVTKLSPALHPVAVSRWFTTPNVDLVLDDEEVSPLVWLSSGGAPDAAAALAGAIDGL